MAGVRRLATPGLPRPLKLVIQWGVSLGILVAIAFVLREQFGSITAADVPLPPLWSIAAAVGTFVVANELLVRGWLGLVALGGARLDRRLGRWVWAKSQLARYAIGMAQVASRAIVARRFGLKPSTSAITTLLEVVWYTCINGALVLATVPWWLPGTGLGWAAWFALLPGLVIVLALSSPGLFIRAALLLAKVPPLNRLGAEYRVRDLRVTRGDSARLTGLYVGNALIRLSGFTAIYLGVGGSPEDLLRVTGAFALGHLIGAVAVFAPGGLGPREGVTAIVLAPVIGPGPVLMLVAATRLLELVAELLYAGVARTRSASHLAAHPDLRRAVTEPARADATDPPPPRLTGRATETPPVGTVPGREHPT
ncbi:lysylphosphatidylglycerol synthase domain-containing protein [soil metagenome]